MEPGKPKSGHLYLARGWTSELSWITRALANLNRQLEHRGLIRRAMYSNRDLIEPRCTLAVVIACDRECHSVPGCEHIGGGHQIE